MYWFIFFFTFSSLIAEQIQIGSEILTVEIVKTHEESARGLMGRTELAEGHGMLFIYENEQPLSFWMKNTLIPLSIAFFDRNQRCINTLDMDLPTAGIFVRYRSAAPALYALEVPQGWFQEHGIDRGAKFSFLDESDQVK